MRKLPCYLPLEVGSSGYIAQVKAANSTTPGLIILLFLSKILDSMKANQGDVESYNRYFEYMTNTPAMFTRYGPERLEKLLRKAAERKMA